jgi:hypothetical protein
MPWGDDKGGTAARFSVHKPLLGLAVVAAATAGLTSCKFGVTEPASRVHDTSAVLNGRAYSEEAGTTRWWFEYGPTPALGSSTPEVQTHVNAGSAVPVSSLVDGLNEGTTYYYRTCAGPVGGSANCATTYQLTTGTGRDSVTGTGIVEEIPQLGYVKGVYTDVSSDPSGGLIDGMVQAMPGVAYFRVPDEGPITCMRVVGNQAVIGFIADATEYDPEIPLVPRIIFVEDNGATGDRVSTTTIGAPVDVCPEPSEYAATGQVTTRGNIVVHDHPAT